jgi:hypothetical protein
MGRRTPRVIWEASIEVLGRAIIALAVGGTVLSGEKYQAPSTLHASPSADNRRCAVSMHAAVQKVKVKGVERVPVRGSINIPLKTRL